MSEKDLVKNKDGSYPHSFKGEKHYKGGGIIRSLIFGFNDGLVSVYALVAGVSGAMVSNEIVLLAGFAGLAAGATSMGLNAYISTKSQG